MMNKEQFHDMEHDEERSKAQDGAPLLGRVLDPHLAVLLVSLRRLEDRLILACLPALVLALILWAVATAYPVVGTAINLLVSILVILVFCLVTIRTAETIWRWARILKTTRVSEEAHYGYLGGITVMSVLVFFGLFALTGVIEHAGEASGERTAVIAALLVLLASQYLALAREAFLHQGEQ